MYNTVVIYSLYFNDVRNYCRLDILCENEVTTAITWLEAR